MVRSHHFRCSFCSSHWNMHVGHTFIDVLKIDIEGAEFDTLTAFLTANKPIDAFADTKLPIGQLQLELHAWDEYANFAFFHDWWIALENAGLRPFWTEPNLVYVNYAKGAKPNLAEVCHLSCGESRILMGCVVVFVYKYPWESLACIRCQGRRCNRAISRTGRSLVKAKRGDDERRGYPIPRTMSGYSSSTSALIGLALDLVTRYTRTPKEGYPSPFLLNYVASSIDSGFGHRHCHLHCSRPPPVLPALRLFPLLP